MIKFSSTILIALSALISLSSTTPLERRQTSPPCHPNTEGTGVSITCSAVEWGVSQSVAYAPIINRSHRGPGMLRFADWRFEQTGSDPTKYHIKDVGHHNLYISAENNELLLKEYSSTDTYNVWDVRCDWCGPNAGSVHGNIAFGCNITSPVNNWCAQMGSPLAANSDQIHLAPCSHVDQQNFDLWTAVPF